MQQLLEKIQLDYPNLKFAEGSSFCWSPLTQQIFYTNSDDNCASTTYSILHELSHALLKHTQYSTDYELLKLEMAAWEYAKCIAENYDLQIDEEHIQDCLDSYRDWLYKRSICPRCSTKGIQYDNKAIYQCFNCHTRWDVTSGRFCRPYRNYAKNRKSSVTFTVTDDLF